MTQKKQVQTILKSWGNIKKEIMKFVKESNIKELQVSVQKYVRTAQTDLKKLNKMVDIDYMALKKRFQIEKKQIETMVNRVIKAEITRAQKFVKKQKSELLKLQKKVNTFTANATKAAKKRGVKKTTKKKAPARKVAKKTTKKKVAKKKTTKKVTKRTT